jgi:AraC-like DNA-binding protein
MTRHGLDYPQHRRRPAHEPQLEDADWLRREHHERGRSVGAIARELGRSRTMVTLRFHAFGIPIRKQTTYPQLRDAAWLEQQYAAGKSSRTIAREVGCSEAGVRLAAISVGVTPRARPPF